MAIQFSCPKCGVQIQVDESAAGKRGRCPKCRETVSIPTASGGTATKPAASLPTDVAPLFPSSDAVAEPAPQFASKDKPWAKFQQESPATPAAPAASSTAQAAASTTPAASAPASSDWSPPPSLFDSENDEPEIPDFSLSRPKTSPASASPTPSLAPPAASLEAGAEIAPLAPPLRSPVAISRRGSGIKLDQRTILFIAGGLVLVLLLAAGVWWLMQPRLSGKLLIVRLGEIELPAVTVDRRSMDKKATVDSAAVIEYLEREPLHLDSDRMHVLFDVEKGRVKVRVRAPDGKAIYRLDPAEDDVLKAYISRNAVPWSEYRDAQLKKAMGEFFKSLEQLAKKGETSKSVRDFRDSVGLASAVADWGYMVELSRTESGRLVLYPCVHQDKSGRLYFILPEEGGTFQLRGRNKLPTSIPFTGSYDVSVNEEGSAEPPSERPLSDAGEKPVGTGGKSKGKDEERGIGEDEPSSKKGDAKSKKTPAEEAVQKKPAEKKPAAKKPTAKDKATSKMKSGEKKDATTE